MRLLLLATLVLLGHMPVSVSASEQVEKVASSPTGVDWRKHCYGLDAARRSCHTGIFAPIDDGRTRCEGITGWSASITETDSSSDVTFRIGVPRGFAPRTTLRVKIDDVKPFHVVLDSCNIFGCLGRYQSDARLIDQIWNGNSMELSGPTADGQQKSYTFLLSGFGETYTGPSAPSPKLIVEFGRKSIDPMMLLAEQESKISRCEGIQ